MKYHVIRIEKEYGLLEIKPMGGWSMYHGDGYWHLKFDSVEQFIGECKNIYRSWEYLAAIPDTFIKTYDVNYMKQLNFKALGVLYGELK